MTDPFTLETVRRNDVRSRDIGNYSRDRNSGDDAHWLTSGRDTTRINTEQRRLTWLFIVVIGLLAIIVGKTWTIQISHGGEYRAWAEQNRTRIRNIVPPRGIILDRYGEKLASNSANFQLTVTTADLPTDERERTDILERLSALTGISRTEIESKLDEGAAFPLEPVVISDQLPHDTSVALEVETKNLPGVEIAVAASRTYRHDTAYSHVIGYTGKISEEEYKSQNEDRPDYLFNDTIGKTGVEQYFESSLRGTLGKREIEVNALGHQQKVIAETSPVPGDTLVLTLDSGLQEAASDQLEQALRRLPKAQGASAVALDPRTGEVLALVSAPSFSTNEFAKGVKKEKYQSLLDDPRNPLFFRSISGEFPSGSVVKPVIAAAALEEHVVTANTTFTSSGGIRIGEWFFPDWKAGGHGATDVRKAIAESVNTFFYYAGGGDNETFTGLGVDRIRQYAEYFGLNSRLGIDLPHEATGFLPTKEWKLEAKGEPWYIGDTYHLAIGQGDLLVTPLQVASYTSTIANGGSLYRPLLEKELRTAEGEIIRSSSPDVLRSGFISKENMAVVRQGMRDGVLSGSSRSLQSLPFTSAAKTGTAQYGNEGKTHSWFTVFAPYENPEIALTVLIEGGGEGNEAALPAAKNILEWWGNHRR